MAHTGAHLDLSAFSSPEELSTLGLDRLKSALIALGLKCGGTLQVGSADTGGCRAAGGGDRVPWPESLGRICETGE